MKSIKNAATKLLQSYFRNFKYTIIEELPDSELTVEKKFFSETRETYDSGETRKVKIFAWSPESEFIQIRAKIGTDSTSVSFDGVTHNKKAGANILPIIEKQQLTPTHIVVVSTYFSHYGGLSKTAVIYKCGDRFRQPGQMPTAHDLLD